MRPILDRIRDGEILLADGAMGTMLMSRGLKPGECPEIFNLRHPKILEEIARLYLAAGADILQTNTFGGSPLKLACYQLEDKTEDINRNAVVVAKNVAQGRAYVSASCGPTGKILKPYGDTEPDAIYAGYVRQMNALWEAKPDIICIETMTDLNEATLAIRAAKATAPSIPVMATMTFEPTPKGFYTIMGVSIPMAVTGLEAAGADIIGSNCGNGVEQMVEIAKKMRERTRKPLVIRPNAGLPQMIENKLTYLETPAFMAEKLTKFIELGVAVIGGCCGTTPEHIRCFRTILNTFRPASIQAPTSPSITAL